jgi:hypothetical protein
LREIGERRLARLRKREDRLRCHLESDRGKNDWQSLHFLLHQIEVERNDLFHNLKQLDYVPKPGKPKRDRSNPAVVEPQPPERKEGPGPVKGKTCHPILKPVPGNGLPRFRNKNDKPQDRSDTDQDGRSWCSAPFVEVKLPIRDAKRIVDALLKYKTADERDIVRSWAAKTFGSLEAAKPVLLAGAKIQADPAVYRGWLACATTAAEYRDWTDEQLKAAMTPDAKGEALRARRTVIALASSHWVTETVKSIKASAPAGADKDTLDRRLRAGLKGFFSAANGGQHSNPQFPYLTEERAVIPMDSVVSDVLRFLEDDDANRYVRDRKDDRKRHRVTILQKALGAARPRRRLELARRRWAGRPVISGTITRKRDAALVWDAQRDEDGLALALPIGGFAPIDPETWIYQDGRRLDCDKQLLTKTGRGTGCAILPLILKHDFRRWYAKHVRNHDADAPQELRCEHNTTQFVLVDPHGQQPRLFIRPVLKFYEPNKQVPGTHEAWRKPQCRYLVGIDRGVNYVLRAVVVDTQELQVVADIGLPGRKHEWKAIREEIAYHQRMRDLARNQGKPQEVVLRHVKAVAKARRKDRALGKTETVEAVAKLVDQCEGELGSGNYCFVLENLELGAMNLKRNNRVKHLAAVEDALVNQMRKRGYLFRPKSGKVDGVRFEAARFTSQIAPSGWWARREEIEKAWNADKTRPIGRRVGNWYEMPAAEAEGQRPDVYRRGEWRKPRNEAGRPYGRSRFVVEPRDENPANPRRLTWGSELFWDPTCKEFNGASFPEGVVLDADFIGALNIALRPLVNDGQGKGFTTERMAEAHQSLNPKVTFACSIPAYRFEGPADDPRRSLRRVMV